MICPHHNHWSEDACLTCRSDAQISPAVGTADMGASAIPEPSTSFTAPVTGATGMTGPIPRLHPDDPMAIPPFLWRKWDNSFETPPPPPTKNAAAAAPVAPAPQTISLDDYSDAALMAVLEDENLSCLARQPVYRELQRRETRRKSMLRIADMKAKKAAKDVPPTNPDVADSVPV